MPELEPNQVYGQWTHISNPNTNSKPLPPTSNTIKPTRLMLLPGNQICSAQKNPHEYGVPHSQKFHVCPETAAVPQLPTSFTLAVLRGHLPLSTDWPQNLPFSCYSSCGETSYLCFHPTLISRFLSLLLSASLFFKENSSKEGKLGRNHFIFC